MELVVFTHGYRVDTIRRYVQPRHADVAQLVEQLIRNQQVIGSSPIVGSTRCAAFPSRKIQSSKISVFLDIPFIRLPICHPGRSVRGLPTGLRQRLPRVRHSSKNAACRSQSPPSAIENPEVAKCIDLWLRRSLLHQKQKHSSSAFQYSRIEFGTAYPLVFPPHLLR
jgi:hypothetical protein